MINLEWATHEENNAHAIATGLAVKTPKGADCPLFGRINIPCSKPILQKDLSGLLIKEWPSARQITRDLGYGFKAISAACIKTNRVSFGYRWEFKIKNNETNASRNI